jgi:hypothetical protein
MLGRICSKSLLGVSFVLKRAHDNYVFCDVRAQAVGTVSKYI